MRRFALLLSLNAVLTCCVQAPVLEPLWRTGPPQPESPRLPLPAWQEIGKSVAGRPIQYRKIGRGFRQVLWIGGIHGDEIEGSAATASLPEAFLYEPGLASIVTLHIVEDMNPDGRAAHRRSNDRGVDLNRDFPARNRRRGRGLSQPESRVIHDLIRRIEPDLVIVAHSWRGDYFINYDGPARALAQLFSRHCEFRVRPSTSFSSTPGSMGSWCGWDMRIPILTIEWQRGTSPAVAWDETRAAILSVIRGRAATPVLRSDPPTP